MVVKPKVSDRDTCVCIKHKNIDLIIEALHRNRITEHSTSSKLLSSITCNRWTESCLIRSCKLCCDKNLTFEIENGESSTYYYAWKTVKENRISAKTNKEIIVQRTIKKKEICSKKELVHFFLVQWPLFIEHVIRMEHQNNVVQKKKKELKDTELLTHVDFSQNYEYLV